MANFEAGIHYGNFNAVTCCAIDMQSTDIDIVTCRSAAGRKRRLSGVFQMPLLGQQRVGQSGKTQGCLCAQSPITDGNNNINHGIAGGSVPVAETAVRVEIKSHLAW